LYEYNVLLIYIMEQHKERIKVLMFGWEFPPHNSGGLGVACLGLTRELLQEDVDVLFVLPRKFDIDNSALKILFASKKPLRYRFVDSSLYEYVTSTTYDANGKPTGSTRYGKSLIDEVKRYARKAADIAESEDFNVIHAHDWLAFPAGVAAQRVSHRPLVAHVHSTEYDRTGGNFLNEEVYRLEKKGIQKADKVIAVSQFTKNIITNHYGTPAHKVEVVHNGVDQDPAGHFLQELPTIKKNFKVVLFVGRLTMQKGPDYFLHAAKKVLARRRDVVFVMAGSGDMKEKLIEETVKLGIAGNVIFTGFLRDQKLNTLYRSADLFVMPSISEPFGISSLESLINGTPVLLSKQSGVSEVISHALKVDFWDTNEMANQILAALSYDSLKKTLSENGHRQVKTVTWNESARKTKSIYKNLLA
jgi:glycogen synthase